MSTDDDEEEENAVATLTTNLCWTPTPTTFFEPAVFFSSTTDAMRDVEVRGVAVKVVAFKARDW